MAIDSDKLFARLDELGPDVVEERLAGGAFGKEKVPYVELWLRRQKRQPVGGIEAKRAMTSAEPAGFRRWLRQHAVEISIVLGLLAVLAGFVGPIPSWFSGVPDPIETPEQFEKQNSDL